MSGFWSSPRVLWPGVVAVMAMVGCLDYATAHEFNLFVFYFVPVCMGAWKLGLTPSVILAISAAALWFCADHLAGHTYASQLAAVWNTLIRLSAFIFVGWATARLSSLLSREQSLSRQLKQSLAQIKVLEGIIPICAGCKKIRDAADNWQSVESYVRDRSNADFSHGLCPDCAARVITEAGIKPRTDQNEIRDPGNSYG